jgi:hypothetical protein
MTEAEWLACRDPTSMLRLLLETGKTSERKLRLFGVACCRRLWELSNDAVREAVEVAERFADTQATAAELHLARTRAKWFARGYPFGARARAAVRASSPDAREAASATGPAVFAAYAAAGQFSGRDAESTAHCDLLRCIFDPLPFGPLLPLARSILTWRDSTVMILAEDAYERRELPCGHLELMRLAVLADALVDAGCTDAQILEHLRGPGPHCRGCWALDLVLNRS